MQIGPDLYSDFLQGKLLVDPQEKIYLVDHLGGFDLDLSNPVLDHISQRYRNPVLTQYRFDDRLMAIYPDINLSQSFELQQKINFKHFFDYRVHPEQTFRKFICSFNGSDHVSRKLLVAILHRFGWFDSETCSKNFSYTVHTLDGHLADYVDPTRFQLLSKFFIGSDSDCFFRNTHTFDYTRFDHKKNVYTLETKITQSFLHVVSETMATSYYPFVTEKFLYSVVTRGLFLAYAQPRWHEHLVRFYGFKKYQKIFDYEFDHTLNPAERLVELMSMLSKFSVLSSDDWRDLYHMEIDTIEFNYDHYFSGKYLETAQSDL